jgi:hypothetical protein
MTDGAESPIKLIMDREKSLNAHYPGPESVRHSVGG